MDPNPLTRARGRARGPAQTPLSQTQATNMPCQPGPCQPGPHQPGQRQPGPRQPGPRQPGLRLPGPRQPGLLLPGRSQPSPSQPGPRLPGPRLPGPRQPGLLLPGPSQPSPSQPAPHQSGSQGFRPQSVEQVTSGLECLTTGDVPMSIGRGAVRGRQVIENPYFRRKRPESSTSTNNGKQGSAGTVIQLISNYFPITTYTDWSLYQYHVSFNPEQDRTNIQRGLLSAHKDVLGAFIFDGTMLFSSRKYKPDTLELTSKRTSDDQIVIITIKFTSIIEKGDHASIQVFNLLLRRCLRKLNLTLVGRNYYDAEAKIEVPEYKLQLWPGYETTIGMFDSGLLLRSEISTKVMREDTVLDFLRDCAANRNRSANWMMNFKAGVIGSVVLTRYNNHTYRIDDIDENSTTESTFCKKDGSRISYAEYYKQKYDINLSGERQPMLISKKKKSFRIEGDESELVYLVPELCTFTGITEVMRKNNYLMENLAEYTRVGPAQRINRYNHFINRILTTPESAESLKQWNLTLSNKLVTIKGRVLNNEVLHGNNHKYSTGNNADWTVHVRTLPMFTSAIIKHWVIVTPNDYGHTIRPFLKTLEKVSKGLSFRLSPPEIVETQNPSIAQYATTLDRIINQKNPSFILVVIKSPRSDLYSVIKRQLCIDRAVPSQVVLSKQIEKNVMSVVTKIAIQINCKIGGAPWRVVIPEKNMMIVGFDVCHDKQNRNKSYGALVATMNDSHTTYFSCVQPHESGQELSSYFAMSIAKALNKYKYKNNTLPSSIVIYRDGVGDGQLSYVHKTEVDMVKKTCEEFYGEKKIGLAFIIVKKRISTRFFHKNHPHNNPPPGTVIDNTVTDPTMYDFYLVSQHVTKGTVTPTHYNVIVDTLSDTTSEPITPTKMQELTYKLTHMYYNWTGTVRVPALCQLAHKLAFLTGQSLQNSSNPGLEDLLYFL